MTPSAVKRLEVGYEVATGGFCGRVTCIDLTDDDKIVIKWDCAESEDVLSETSPLWSRIEPLC
jgi:preprotein translocase subunit YajC